MLGKVAFLSVALVAIFLGKDYVNFKSQLAWIRGCHGGHYSPHKFLATKTPYDSPSADLKSHHDHGMEILYNRLIIQDNHCYDV